MEQVIAVVRRGASRLWDENDARGPKKADGGRNRPEVRQAGAVQEAADRSMSKPTPIVLILVGIGLGLFVLRIFGIEPLQYKWVLAISICLVSCGAYLYVIEKRQNSN